MDDVRAGSAIGRCGPAVPGTRWADVSGASAAAQRWRWRLITLVLAGALVTAASLAGVLVPRPAGSARPTVAAAITRTDVMVRARVWVSTKVAYSMEAYHDGYRTDCSGFVSMAWRADDSYTTRSIFLVTHDIAKDDLKPGDALLWRKTFGDEIGHIRLFGGWLDSAHSWYWVYEETAVAGTAVRTEYSWAGSVDGYRPIRYDHIAEDPPPSVPGAVISGGRGNS